METIKEIKLRGKQQKVRWNAKFIFDGEVLLDRDFTTLDEMSKKFNVSYNTLRSMSSGRCKRKNPLFKNLIITKL